MKEIIVIENPKFIEYFKHTDNDYYEHIVEQVPENWEELKELCKGLNRIRIANIEGTESIVLDNTLIFNKYGNVFAEFPEYTYCFARNRTIPQIWAFIKSLIGEE